MRIEDRQALRGGCLLGAGSETGGLGEFGAALGIAFQITDDILDCAGETVDTGKIVWHRPAGRDAHAALIYAAREDEVVRGALDGGRSTEC